MRVSSTMAGPGIKTRAPRIGSGFRVRAFSATRNDQDFHLSNSPSGLPVRRKPTLRTLFLCGAGYAVVFAGNRRPSIKAEGARDAGPGPDGPAGLVGLAATGYAEAECACLWLFESLTGHGRKSASSQGVPRAVFMRLAPHPPRWSSVRSGQALTRPDTPPNEALALGRRSSDQRTGLPAVRGLGVRRARRVKGAAWTAGWEPCVASPTPFRPPLPAPRLETLIRHPSVTRRDATGL